MTDERAAYDFVLYVAGSGARSSKTIANMRRICSRYLGDRHQLEVVDVRSYPERAASANILITPTLVRRTPSPQRRLVGDLSNTEAVLYELDLDLAAETVAEKGDCSREHA